MTEPHADRPSPSEIATSGPPGPVSRRLLLGGAGAIGALTAAGQLVEDPALAATTRGRLPGNVDVVVVGGGISGLVAARKVREKGRSVLVLEARDRVGGRVLNHELRNGSVIESGGAFVGPTQTHIMRLAEALGVDTFKEYVQGNNIYVKQTPAGGEPIAYTGTIPPDPTILPDAGQLQERIDQMASEIDVSAPWKHPNAQEWDSTSFDTWVR